jgi:hypothetical protein
MTSVESASFPTVASFEPPSGAPASEKQRASAEQLTVLGSSSHAATAMAIATIEEPRTRRYGTDARVKRAWNPKCVSFRRAAQSMARNRGPELRVVKGEPRRSGFGASACRTGSRVAGSGASVGRTGSRVAGSGAWVRGTGSRVAGTGASVRGTGSRVAGSDASVDGTRASDPGTRASVPGTGPLHAFGLDERISAVQNRVSHFQWLVTNGQRL